MLVLRNVKIMEKGAAYHEEEQLSAEFILLSVKIGVSHDLPLKKESSYNVRLSTVEEGWILGHIIPTVLMKRR